MVSLSLSLSLIFKYRYGIIDINNERYIIKMILHYFPVTLFTKFTSISFCFKIREAYNTHY